MEKKYIKALIEKSASGKYTVLASTSAVDRQGDSIDQSGWDVSNFKNNPVMLWAHDYSALPIAKATDVTVTQQGLTLNYEFAPAEGNPMAQQVKVLVDEGFLNAVSVGFMPLERNGNVITKMELFEVSFVPVPANPQALQLMLSKGIAHDVISKFFEVKAGELELAQKSIDSVTINAKGAVSDEINAEEAAELKWDKWDEFTEIIGALWTVYFDENTSVDAFPALLLETAQLITDFANDGAPSEDEEDDQNEAITAGLKIALKKAVTKEAARLFVIKVGAQHSAATKDAISTAIDHMQNATTVLTNLVGESGTEDDKEGKGVEEDAAEVGGIEEVRALLITRDLLRVQESAPRSALGVVNALLKEREATRA